MPDESLSVSVDRVLYPSETVERANWFIIAVNRDGTEIIAKGNMAWRPQQKERLKLTGKWGSYQGKREFRFTEAALDLPTDARGMLHYVCELAPGVGAAMEEQIWELKGEDWASIEEGALPRLKGRVYLSLMEAIERAEADREKGTAIAELLKAGCTMNMATAAWEQWKANTIGVVSNNPYRLAELPNYGFSHVDGVIRIHYGITDADPRRIRAAVVYVLRQITESGSTLVPWEALHAQCIAKLGGYQSLIVEAVRDMFAEGTLKGFQSSKSVSLASDYKNEAAIWDYINQEAS